QLRLPLPMIRTRRFRPERAGRRIDLRATLRESLREGGDIIALVRAAPGELHPPLVVLCDISGSMNPYSRMFLHFLHAITNDRDRGAGEGLGEEMERLAKSSRYLVWLNPLLRYDKFEARPAGVRAILPHVDLFLPVHNLKSLVDLAKTLNGPMTRQNQEKRA